MSGRGAGRKRRRVHRTAPRGGRLDSDVVFRIKQYLRKEHMIPFSQIKTEHAVKIAHDRCILLGKLSRREILQISGIVHTPDIAVTDRYGNPVLLIEQDGRIHESAAIMERDRVRNIHYGYSGIPYIVLNTGEIRAEGVIPGAYLDREMERIGMKKPAGSGPPFSS